MRSAVLRLPSLITQLMNLLTSGLSYSGSAGTSRFGISRLRGITHQLTNSRTHQLRFLRPLGPVLRPPLHAALHADRVQRAAHHVIAHARQVLDASAANQDERVLLEVVADTGDVSRDFDAVRQPDARDLSQRGVRLLRRLSEDA